MFNMSGHAVTVCGIVGDGDEVAEVLELCERSGFKREPDEITMVVWGEDMAKVPLLVYDDQGQRVGTASTLGAEADTDGESGVRAALIAMYDNAARIINAALELEQKALAAV